MGWNPIRLDDDLFNQDTQLGVWTDKGSSQDGGPRSGETEEAAVTSLGLGSFAVNSDGSLSE